LGINVPLMITLTDAYGVALAQMRYFVWVQMPFTGGEDGLQGVPRGRRFGVIDLADNTHLHYLVFAIFLCGFFADLSHHSFAVRPGAQIHTRKRAARDFAGLRCG
jgi:hypothetical protein